jgi:hypothetical protein
MTRDKIVWLLIGMALYFGFLKFKGVVGGMPWAPRPVAKAAA